MWHKALRALVYDLKPRISWLAVTPSVIRYLLRTGEKYAARDKKELGGFAFGLGSEHPVYEVFPHLLPRSEEPYAFYIRVPDLPDFLRHIAPVLERRIAESAVVGYSGELKLNFYRDGLRMVFERGRLADVHSRPPGGGESAAFPNLTFLHLLFGHRSLEDLRLSYRDCFANDEASMVLRVLFPKQPSAIWTPG